MPNPFQQKARQRKIVYLGLIVALFTASLLHRRLVVERQAEDLQLRETARGEVELTSSFVRVSLIGSRALATTVLWSTALDRMAKHEWNELELVVSSISKLQPYFITPWVFQSWNLAFNVAVECDRPRDKYYYVSRGLELLAEGERRNQGTTAEAAAATGRPRFPGQPEMRYYMGFYYQLKIGNSDEKITMRSLFDLSCIDPLHRNADDFWDVNERGQRKVKRDKLARLCQDHPRLVRRLREQLGYEDPKRIVEFLEANQDVPSRFKPRAAPGQTDSELEVPRKQFPILPPVQPPRGRSDDGPAWPDPLREPMTAEALDVFVVCRTWYQYAQEPLPPPNPDPGVTEKEIEQIRKLDRDRRERGIIYRPNKSMMIQIFRGYPSRAQAYIAENLEDEGWFDESGWLIQDWFESNGADEEVRVGSSTKYHAGLAWEIGNDMYRRYGRANGLYLTPAEIAELNKKAAAIRKALDVARGSFLPPLRPEWRATLQESYNAHQKLQTSFSLRSTTNFDNLLAETEAEKDPQTVLTRKLLFHAERYNRKNQNEALALYEKAWPLWLEISLRYPEFARIGTIQEDVYEEMLHYQRLSQLHNPELFRGAALAAGQAAIAPHPLWPRPVPWNWAGWPYWDGGAKVVPLVDSGMKARHFVRASRGPLESVAFYDGPEAAAVRDYWTGLTATASRLGQLGFTPPVLAPNYALAGAVSAGPSRGLPDGWHLVIDADAIRRVRERLGMFRPLTPADAPNK